MITAARETDRAEIVGLLEASALPTSDLTPALFADFLVYRVDGRIMGVVGLERSGESALLRSLAVDPAGRHQGVGALLTYAAERLAASRGVTHLYLLTTTATAFFKARGYRTADRRQAPPSIRATAQFSRLCPSSSTFMMKPL